MAEKSSLRRSLRARSLESRPSPSHMSFDEASASNDADDDDGTKNNKLAKKKQMNQSIQPNRRALRKRKVSFKECVTDQKEDSVPEKKRKCDSIEHRQKILSNKWYVDYYDNDTDSVFDVKKCCLCPKKFFSNFALKKHFDVVHKKENFSCQSCSKAFSHAQVLECHERQVHPVRLMPSAMFHTPEIQDILRNCIKQEENIEMSLPQPQRQLPSLLDVVNQAELQNQSYILL
ncbi:hypothetical protein LSTR_LSTR005474 [Laodelphax striatellus]|uniref:C2H2-type domain-containing protein n=1 Tax=Laodelphax striatellus TaxID=195883 RepID=A0A482WWS9_LAOST|nr:hypothetical protein LSTR_LSTR005474 [Laodelphax striatellus]